MNAVGGMALDLGGKTNGACCTTPQINTWYKGRNESSVVLSAARGQGLVAVVRPLGPVLQDNGSVRIIMRVDIVGANHHDGGGEQRESLTTALALFGCTNSTV